MHLWVHFIPFITHWSRHIAETFLERPINHNRYAYAFFFRLPFPLWVSPNGIIFKKLLSGKVASGTDQNHFNLDPIWAQTVQWGRQRWRKWRNEVNILSMIKFIIHSSLVGELEVFCFCVFMMIMLISCFEVKKLIFLQLQIKTKHFGKILCTANFKEFQAITHLVAMQMCHHIHPQAEDYHRKNQIVASSSSNSQKLKSQHTIW